MPGLRLFFLFFFSISIGWTEKFPELPNTESTTDADPPSAEESARAFSLPEGTKVKVWASEPMVQNPIGMAWDKRGRMWVAENYTYGSGQLGLPGRTLNTHEKQVLYDPNQ